MISRIFLLCLFAFQLSAQTIIIKGIIKDSSSQITLPYVTVSVKNTSIGTYSNENGAFTLYLKSIYLDSTLVIHSLGYKSKRFKIKALSGEVITILLKQDEIELPEVIVRDKYESPKNIIKNAIKNIPINYPTSPYTLGAYYREYLRYDTMAFVNLFESAITVRDTGFNVMKYPTNIKILHSRFDPEVPFDSIFLKEYTNSNTEKGYTKRLPGYDIKSEGNELLLLLALDPIRLASAFTFSFVNIFSKNFIINHKLNLKSIERLDGEEVWVINFTYGKNEVFVPTSYNPVVKMYDIKGTVYIRRSDYSIIKFEYINTDNYEIKVEYKPWNGKMYLKYMTFKNKFVQNLPDSLTAKYRVPQSKIPPFITKIEQTSPNSFKVKFNKPVKPEFAEDNSSYRIRGYFPSFPFAMYNKSLIFPEKVVYNPEDTSAMITLERKLIPFKDNMPFDKFSGIEMKNAIDYMGNVAGGYTLKSFYQMRELFVNDIDGEAKTGKELKENIPLHKQIHNENPDFWKNYNRIINQPLK